MVEHGWLEKHMFIEDPRFAHTGICFECGSKIEMHRSNQITIKTYDKIKRENLQGLELYAEAKSIQDSGISGTN